MTFPHSKARGTETLEAAGSHGSLRDQSEKMEEIRSWKGALRDSKRYGNNGVSLVLRRSCWRVKHSHKTPLLPLLCITRGYTGISSVKGQVNKLSGGLTGVQQCWWGFSSVCFQETGLNKCLLLETTVTQRCLQLSSSAPLGDYIFQQLHCFFRLFLWDWLLS